MLMTITMMITIVMTIMMMIITMMMFQPEQRPSPNKWRDAAGSSGKFRNIAFGGVFIIIIIVIFIIIVIIAIFIIIILIIALVDVIIIIITMLIRSAAQAEAILELQLCQSRVGLRNWMRNLSMIRLGPIMMIMVGKI